MCEHISVIDDLMINQLIIGELYPVYTEQNYPDRDLNRYLDKKFCPV